MDVKLVKAGCLRSIPHTLRDEGQNTFILEERYERTMRRNDKEKNDDPEVNPYDFYERLNIGSQTECTGMIPTPPLNEGQQDGYHDIYSVPQQCSTGAQKLESAKEQKKKSSVKGGKDMPLG